MQYNKDNVFYKIIHKEINSDIVFEGKHFIVIKDIKPKAPIHMLIIPRGNYVDYGDFISNASDEEILDFNKAIKQTLDMMHLNESGYQLISNSGRFGKQEVPHMHVHVLGNTVASGTCKKN